MINLSLGGASAGPSDTAVENAVINGVMVFAAAGNDGAGGVPEHPAAAASAMAVAVAVASVDQSLARSSFSTTGAYVDLAAPGGSILSTYASSIYARLSWTSTATPYAPATGALVPARHPSWTVAQARERLLTTADDLGTSGRDNDYGCGFIDPVAAAG